MNQGSKLHELMKNQFKMLLKKRYWLNSLPYANPKKRAAVESEISGVKHFMRKYCSNKNDSEHTAEKTSDSTLNNSELINNETKLSNSSLEDQKELQEIFEKYPDFRMTLRPNKIVNYSKYFEIESENGSNNNNIDFNNPMISLSEDEQTKQNNIKECYVLLEPLKCIRQSVIQFAKRANENQTGPHSTQKIIIYHPLTAIIIDNLHHISAVFRDNVNHNEPSTSTGLRSNINDFNRSLIVQSLKNTSDSDSDDSSFYSKSTQPFNGTNS